MTLLFTIAGLAPEFGGPSRSVPLLAEALAQNGTTVRVLTCESLPGQMPPLLPTPSLVPATLLPVRSRQRVWRASKNDFWTTLQMQFGEDSESIVHDNGLWLACNHAVARATQAMGKPRVISPRGMLSQWAISHRSWKKRLAWLLFQRRDLLSASAIHATSREEADDCRRVGYSGPVAVVPNGVDCPGSGELRLERTSGIRKALCVARLHPVKGLMNLVEAWHQVRPQGWRMVLAGGDEEGHRAELTHAIAARGLSECFEFVGAVDGKQKAALYRDADLFILPSYSENFGISIAEALAWGVPVITTHSTPWRELHSYRCGWWIETGVTPLVNALRVAAGSTEAELFEMGQRGRCLIEQRYSWAGVTNEMTSMYNWLLGKGERPKSVLCN